MNIDKALIEKAGKVLKDWGNSIANDLRDNLRERLKSGQYESDLAQSIKVEDTFIIKNKVQFVLSLNDYYIYVDLGVKGLNNKSVTYSNNDFPSGFRFRNMSTPKDMVNALQSYIARKGIPVRKSKSQSTQSVINQSFSMAYAMAKAIKKKGIDGTLFFTDVYNENAFLDLEKRLELALGTELEITIAKTWF